MKFKYISWDQKQDKILYKTILFRIDFILKNEENQNKEYLSFIKENIFKEEDKLLLSFIEKIKICQDNEKRTKKDLEILQKIIKEYKNNIIQNLTEIFFKQLNWNKLNIGKNKMIIGDNEIILKNEYIYWLEDLSQNNIYKKIEYIVDKKIKNIFEDKIQKRWTFEEYLENTQENTKYNYKQEIKEILEKIKIIYDKEFWPERLKFSVRDYLITFIETLNLSKYYKSILFYDLETLINNKEIVSGAFFGINLTKQWPDIFLIMLYNDIDDLKDYNISYKQIVEMLKQEWQKKLRKLMKEKNFWIYFMEKKQFVQNYIARIKEREKIPILSWFNIVWFDNPVLFDNNENLVNISNSLSIDFFEFLTKENDKGELNLLSKNLWLGSKLMTHEELINYLKPGFLNNPKNFDWIAKMILYNIIDTLLTVQIFQQYIYEIRTNKKEIRGATKMLETQDFIKYIKEKLLNIQKF